MQCGREHVSGWVPRQPAAIGLGAPSSITDCLAQYGIGSGPVLFGAGYVRQVEWWKTGFLMSLIYLFGSLIIGPLWWLAIGLIWRILGAVRQNTSVDLMNTKLRRDSQCLALLTVLLFLAPPAWGQTASNALSNADESFIKQTYQEVIASERLAVLAANRGYSGAVRSLGAGAVGTLRNIHERIRHFARNKGVTLSDDLTAQNQYAIDTLVNASGDDFDQTYLKLILDYLPRILSEFETVAGATHDPDLKAITTRAIPKIQARIRAANAAKNHL